MFQRIQTLFLSIVAIAMIVLIGTPVWTKNTLDNTQSATLTALQLSHQQGVSTQITPVWYIALLAGASAAVAIFTMFQFKNRLLQAMLCAVNSIIMTVLMGLIMYFSFGVAKNWFDPDATGDFKIGFYALIISIVANFLANRFIRRDEKLVRSQDRMR